MAGLNYGYSYTCKAGTVKNKTIGVSYAPNTKKWIVRVAKGGTNQVITIACFNTKEEAEEFFINYH